MRLVLPVVALSLLAACALGGCRQAPPRLTSLPGSAHPAYTITDLGAGLPSDINNQGQVIGEYAAGVSTDSHHFQYMHGCLWDRGKRLDMPTLGGRFSDAEKITDGGQIIGSAEVSDRGARVPTLQHACLWDGVKLTDLEANPRFRGTGALHVTKSGAVYIVSPPQGPKSEFHLWFYPAGFGPGVRRDVGVIGGPKIKPLLINDNGMVVGTWDTGEMRNKMAAHHAFVWHRGDKKWQDMGTLGGLSSEPTGLNDAGQVVGDAGLADDPLIHRGMTHAFLWQNGRMKDLDTLPGSYFSRADAINAKGQIVGFRQVEGNGLIFQPLLWEHGQIKDLSLLIPSGTPWGDIGSVAGINDKGQIVGDGSIADPKDHYAHGYLLTPI